MGQLDGLGCPELTSDTVAARSAASTTPQGQVIAVQPAEQMSDTPAHWRQPATLLGADAPVWQPRG
jgi:hypothetical protein